MTKRNQAPIVLLSELPVNGHEVFETVADAMKYAAKSDKPPLYAVRVYQFEVGTKTTKVIKRVPYAN